MPFLFLSKLAKASCRQFASNSILDCPKFFLWLNLKLKNEMIRDSHHESLNPEKINQSRFWGHLVSFWVTGNWAQAAKTPFHCQLKSWLNKACIKLWSLAILSLSIIFSAPFRELWDGSPSSSWITMSSVTFSFPSSNFCFFYLCINQLLLLLALY